MIALLVPVVCERFVLSARHASGSLTVTMVDDITDISKQLRLQEIALFTVGWVTEGHYPYVCRPCRQDVTLRREGVEFHEEEKQNTGQRMAAHGGHR